MAHTQDPRRQAILLIDAEVLVRHELAEYLRHCGYRVVEASGTDEAVSVLSEAGDRIDALLCDAGGVGETSAFELARWVREHHPHLPVMLAASHEKAAQQAGELCDEGPALSRPYDPALVVGRIRRSLAARARARNDRG